jgi:putative toxin-antitoxin system antitoxin component (TIGR02293 family)
MTDRTDQTGRTSKTATPGGPSRPRGTAGRHEYLALLGLRSFDTAALVKRLQQGISYAAFERLKKNLGVTSQELAEAALISRRTLARRKQSGRLRPDESDRLVRLARVFAEAIDLFVGDTDAARSWMRKASRALGGASPFEMARTEVGTREVEHLIARAEHGVFG